MVINHRKTSWEMVIFSADGTQGVGIVGWPEEKWGEMGGNGEKWGRMGKGGEE